MARLGFPRYAERIARPDGVTGPAWYRWLRDLWTEVLALRTSVTALETETVTEDDAEPATYDELLVLVAWLSRRVDFLEQLHKVKHGSRDPGHEPNEIELLSDYNFHAE